MIIVPGIPEGLVVVRYGKCGYNEADVFSLSSGNRLSPVVPDSNQEFDSWLVKAADGYVIVWDSAHSLFAVTKKLETPIRFVLIPKTEYAANLLRLFAEKNEIEISLLMRERAGASS